MKPFFFIFIYIFTTLNVSAQGLTKYGQSTSTSTNFVNKNGKIGNSPEISINGQVLVLASLSTTAVSSMTYCTASSGGNVSSDGGMAVTARGVCWKTSTGPTITDSKTTDGTGTGTFSSSMTGLEPSTTYYLRAYATNMAGTVYGNEISFTTSMLAIGNTFQGGVVAYILQSGDPGYTTGETHGIITAPSDQSTGLQWSNGSYYSTGATATALGTGNSNTNIIVSSQGAGSYAAQLCYDLVLGDYSDWYLPSKDELTKLYNNRVAIGGFTSNYYWTSSEDAPDGARRRHFGTGAESGDYKNMPWLVRTVRSFPSVPIVTTETISSIISTTAAGGGYVSSVGAAVTVRGVCWSTSPNPTIANSKTTDGTGTGTFTSSITGLEPNTTYYIRAYATNSVGISYGNEISFKTGLFIGDSYQGGKVAYILQAGDPGYIEGETHGIIAAPNDLGFTMPWGIPWGCSGTLLSGADGTAIGTGNQNTIDIIAGCSTTGIAARLCGDLELSGYNDWYLPSLDELTKLYLNRTAIGGWATYNVYWSSSEMNIYWVWRVNSTIGSVDYNNKSLAGHVRAVRSF